MLICMVAKWFDPLILQPKQLGGQSLIAGRAPSLKHYDKGLQT